MLTKEEVMDVEISLDFDDFCFDKQFYNPFDLREIIDDSVKKHGLSSNMIYLVNPIVNNSCSADFLKVNAPMNDFKKYSSLEVLNEFFESYSEKMKDEKFAKQAYNFAQHYFTKDEFKEFVNLRKPYKDGFCPENEHAPERER